jgi:hypothetical protein
VGDFEVAELINTPEAAAVLAPYLFDFKTITPQEGDLAGDSNVNEALYTLTQMKLTGAPLSKSPGISNSAYLMEWQRWAIAKGFVPQSWSSRVGAPASWLKLDAIERQPPTLIHSKSSQQTPPSASPSLPTPTNTPSPSPAPSVSATKAPSGSTFTTWGAVVLVLLIIGGVVVMLKRRP